MKTIQIYRPVGLKEMELIAQSNFKEFPPRLVWQPIFYPVANEAYAIEIAQKWNLTDELSGYCGIVTVFDVNSEYLEQYEIQNVGAIHHNEWWIPSEDLPNFNQNIVGEIRICNAFFGERYVPSSLENLDNVLKKFKK